MRALAARMGAGRQTRVHTGAMFLVYNFPHLLISFLLVPFSPSPMLTGLL